MNPFPASMNRMQRTTAPSNSFGMDASRSFDVYRSLPVSVLAARNSPADAVPMVENRAKAEQSRPASSEFDAPYPPVPVACIAQDAIWRDSIDIEELKRRLAAVCNKSELRRAGNSCEFACCAEAEDGNERCEFIINIWSVPEGEEGAQGKYLLQIDRCSGCPYFFQQTLSRAFDIPQSRKTAGRLFRPMKLPECYCDEGKGIRKECVERAISLATSEVFEQRVQGVELLASLCSEKNPNFASLFIESDGPRRIHSLQADADCFVKKAAQKVLAHCA